MIKCHPIIIDLKVWKTLDLFLWFFFWWVFHCHRTM